MASMYRNTNLEEIEVDSFLGIEYLKNQSLVQKIVFIGGFVCGAAMLLVCSLYFKLGTFLSLIVSFPFIILSVAFGCNYNQDLSLIRYLFLLLREPVVKFESKPTEDLDYIRNKTKEFANEAEISSDEIDEEEHKRTLKRFIIGIVAFIVILVIMLVLITVFKDDGSIHHTIS